MQCHTQCFPALKHDVQAQKLPGNFSITVGSLHGLCFVLSHAKLAHGLDLLHCIVHSQAESIQLLHMTQMQCWYAGSDSAPDPWWQ